MADRPLLALVLPAGARILAPVACGPYPRFVTSRLARAPAADLTLLGLVGCSIVVAKHALPYFGTAGCAVQPGG